ncbi:MAG: pyrroline-5-carboxylate reductase [Pleurocapsa minor GSE-CHR-MK-17-07R]|jgi:pyrroline-5-carboxylate reductase|nr:pyrroline-5-carboxylate reductase [Pleurocapsa minor GSE-CHR-MK 17-07R]
MALENTKVAFIGSGVMAEAMMKGLVHQGLLTGDQIVASDPRKERGHELVARYGVNFSANNAEAAHGAQIVVISTKPQVVGEVAKSMAGAAKDASLVLSILAGVRISTLQKLFQNPSIVRAMPNTPAQIGQGITVWTATSDVAQAQHDQARALLGALGDEINVDDEKYLDMATALSGSGPAYVFLVMEALIDAGVHMGFSRRDAEKLVLQTMRGSVEYAMQSNMHTAPLRNQVTSPGGTSAAALYELEKGGLRTVIADGVWAAFRRSIELGDASEQKL